MYFCKCVEVSRSRILWIKSEHKFLVSFGEQMPARFTDLYNTLTHNPLCWQCKWTSSLYLKTSSKVATISRLHPFVDHSPADLQNQHIKYSHLVTVILTEKAEAQG